MRDGQQYTEFVLIITLISQSNSGEQKGKMLAPHVRDGLQHSIEENKGDYSCNLKSDK